MVQFVSNGDWLSSWARYLNGCACGEHVELTKNYVGDIRSLHEYGFDVRTYIFIRSRTTTHVRLSTWASCGMDCSLHHYAGQGVKIDGCGAQRNNTLYAELMRKTSKNYTIEKYCPFHCFRIARDVDYVHRVAVLLVHQTSCLV